MLQIYPGLDIIGGFLNAIGVGIGWYAVNNDMDIQWICFCGMMNFIQGIFSLVTVIDFAVHHSMFAETSLTSTIIMEIVRVVSPILMLAIAAVSYMLYKDYARADHGPGEWRDVERAPLSQASNAPTRQNYGGSTGFTAFQGSGQKLGTNDASN